MTLETLFTICNYIALAGWLLLIFFPGWKLSARCITSAVIPLLLALFYLFLLISHMPGAEGGFGSLSEVSRLFQTPQLLLAGWVHYLVFDLFVGSWQVRDARSRGIPHAWVVPGLLLTLVFGPIGLMFYLMIRRVKTGSYLLD